MGSGHLPGRIETLNGVQLYFEVHGTGEPLVLLHGFAGSSQDWMGSRVNYPLISSSSCRTCAATAGPAFYRSHCGMRRWSRTCSRCSITWESALARESE